MAKTTKQKIMIDIGSNSYPIKDIEKKVKAAAPTATEIWINPSEGKAYYAAEDGSDAVIDLLAEEH